MTARVYMMLSILKNSLILFDAVLSSINSFIGMLLAMPRISNHPNLDFDDKTLRNLL